MENKDLRHLKLSALMVIAGQDSNPLVRELYRRLRDKLVEARAMQSLNRELAERLVEMPDSVSQ
jgi:hypothetical protein